MRYTFDQIILLSSVKWIFQWWYLLNIDPYNCSLLIISRTEYNAVQLIIRHACRMEMISIFILTWLYELPNVDKNICLCNRRKTPLYKHSNYVSFLQLMEMYIIYILHNDINFRLYCSKDIFATNNSCDKRLPLPMFCATFISWFGHVSWRRFKIMPLRADSWFAPSQWETALLYNDVSHWLGASLESGLILGLRSANERRRYFVTTSLIGWAQV